MAIAKPVMLDVYNEGNGSLRVTLREGVGRVDVHSLVRAAVPTLAFDHDGTRSRSKGNVSYDEPYRMGEAVGEIDLWLAGQRVFYVPDTTTRLTFEDGSEFDLTRVAKP